jgi:hypothetical protein
MLLLVIALINLGAAYCLPACSPQDRIYICDISNQKSAVAYDQFTQFESGTKRYVYNYTFFVLLINAQAFNDPPNVFFSRFKYL